MEKSPAGGSIMNLKKIIISAAIAVVVLTAFGLQSSPEHKVLFEKARFAMETKGDLNEAIKLFSELIQKYPGEREYAAKSQLYIGLCYEKLGNAEARTAYERVVRDFADQAEIVAQARVRLAALGGPGGAGGLVTRRVLTDAYRGGEVLTADGKYISHIDRDTGDMVQFEVASGQTSRITNKGGAAAKETPYEYQAFSRDGKQIAYDSYTKDNVPQLRIRNLDGSDLHTLYSEKGYDVRPLDWSPDAGFILASRELDYSPKGGIELTLISTADGSVRVLRSIASAWVSASFSPDGQFVAFSFVGEGSPLHGDVFLMTADGRNEIVVAGHPAEDQLLRWTPDGRSLLFFSDRSETWDIWTVRITGGKQQGEPELLKKDFGNSEVLGFAPDGSLYYKTYTSFGRLYNGAVDLETGKVLVPPAPITTRYTGPPNFLTWSPDGRNLAYLSHPGRIGPGNNILTIRSAATGEERFLSPRLRGVNQISWAPDGRSIIALGFTATGTGAFRIDTETSEITKLADKGVFPHLCPDGKTLVCWGAEGIIKRNLDTGEESEVVKTGAPFYDLSPDGREVVFQVDGAVKTVSLNGGEPRELFRGLAQNYGLRWMRDGRYIIARAFGTASSEIWRVPAQGGTPLKLDLSVPKMGPFALHPDNRRFAFSVNEGSKNELWVMENFLPPLKVVK
jgi:Tol biopolymer transport system component